MSQVDVVTYSAIITWVFILFCISWFIFTGSTFPLFLYQVKIFIKREQLKTTSTITRRQSTLVSNTFFVNSLFYRHYSASTVNKNSHKNHGSTELFKVRNEIEKKVYSSEKTSVFSKNANLGLIYLFFSVLSSLLLAGIVIFVLLHPELGLFLVKTINIHVDVNILEDSHFKKLMELGIFIGFFGFVLLPGLIFGPLITRITPFLKRFDKFCFLLINYLCFISYLFTLCCMVYGGITALCGPDGHIYENIQQLRYWFAQSWLLLKWTVAIQILISIKGLRIGFYDRALRILPFTYLWWTVMLLVFSLIALWFGFDGLAYLVFEEKDIFCIEGTEQDIIAFNRLSWFFTFPFLFPVLLGGHSMEPLILGKYSFFYGRKLQDYILPFIPILVISTLVGSTGVSVLEDWILTASDWFLYSASSGTRKVKIEEFYFLSLFYRAFFTVAVLSTFGHFYSPARMKEPTLFIVMFMLFSVVWPFTLLNLFKTENNALISFLVATIGVKLHMPTLLAGLFVVFGNFYDILNKVFKVTYNKRLAGLSRIALIGSYYCMLGALYEYLASCDRAVSLAIDIERDVFIFNTCLSLGFVFLIVSLVLLITTVILALRFKVPYEPD